MFLLFVFVFFPFPEKYDTLQKKEKKGWRRREKIQKKSTSDERENSSFFSLTLLFELLLPFFRENIINLI